MKCLSSVFVRLVLSRILSRILARVIAERVEKYGEKWADSWTQETIAESVPYWLYSKLEANAKRVADGYVMLVLGGILTLASLWAFSVFGLGPPFFGILPVGWMVVSLVVVYYGFHSVNSGNKALENLIEEIITHMKKGKHDFKK